MTNGNILFFYITLSKRYYWVEIREELVFLEAALLHLGLFFRAGMLRRGKFGLATRAFICGGLSDCFVLGWFNHSTIWPDFGFLLSVHLLTEQF